MTDSCKTCRFWKADDADAPGEPIYGRCKVAPPTLVQPILLHLMPKPVYGDQIDPDLNVIHLVDASQHPATVDNDWCGSFSPTVQPSSPIQQQLDRWYAAYRDLGALDDDAPEDKSAPLWAIVDDAAEQIRAAPATSTKDAAAKLRVNLVLTISAAGDEDIVSGRTPGDQLSELSDLGERGLFDVIVELERGL